MSNLFDITIAPNDSEIQAFVAKTVQQQLQARLGHAIDEATKTHMYAYVEKHVGNLMKDQTFLDMLAELAGAVLAENEPKTVARIKTKLKKYTASGTMPG